MKTILATSVVAYGEIDRRYLLPIALQEPRQRLRLRQCSLYGFKRAHLRRLQAYIGSGTMIKSGIIGIRLLTASSKGREFRRHLLLFMLTLSCEVQGTLHSSMKRSPSQTWGVSGVVEL